jgi:hypothetical protein
MPRLISRLIPSSTDRSNALSDEMAELNESYSLSVSPSDLAGTSPSRSMNHLLNFTYAQRGESASSFSASSASSSSSFSGSRKGGRKDHHHHRSQQRASQGAAPRAHISPQQFVHANCQFLVSPIRDYSAHLADPDLAVPWDCVEMVVLRTHGEQACPICLGPPMAGKITECGHVYCWSVGVWGMCVCVCVVCVCVCVCVCVWVGGWVFL